MVKIYNHRYDEAPPEAVYVGRPTRWGNPYTHIKSKKTRASHVTNSVEDSIKEYFAEIRKMYSRLDTPEARDFFGPLVGKDLICWCAPKGGIEHTSRPLVCHAQILASLAEAHGLMKIKEHDGSRTPPAH